MIFAGNLKGRELRVGDVGYGLGWDGITALDLSAYVDQREPHAQNLIGFCPFAHGDSKPTANLRKPDFRLR